MQNDYAKRGLEIMRYLTRYGVVSMNSSIDRNHLEAIAKIGAGEPLKVPLILPSELAVACIKTRAAAKRGAKKYKLGSYWFSFLDENGNISNKKSGIHVIVFPDLAISIEYSIKEEDGEGNPINWGWNWRQYNEESLFLLSLDNSVPIRKSPFKFK